MNRFAFGIILVFLSLYSIPAWGQATDRKVTIQYTEPSESQCPDTTQLKPVSSPILCLQAMGSEAQQKTCNATLNQNFEMIPQAQAGLFQLQSPMTQKCLKVGTNNSDPVTETTCGIGDQDQVFRIGPSPSPIQSNSGAGGLCLDVAGNSTSDGAKVQSFGCHGGSNQSWNYAQTAQNCPLDDLALTKIYRDVVRDGDPGIEIDVPATAKTGGGQITKTMCVPIKDEAIATGIHFIVSAIDESGNESVKTEEVIWPVAGTKDCTLVTSPNCTEGPVIVDAQQKEWTLGSGGETLRDGVRMANGTGNVYLFALNEVYVRGGIISDAGNWFQWDDPNNQWVNVGATKPLCVVPDTTPPAVPQGLEIIQCTLPACQ